MTNILHSIDKLNRNLRLLIAIVISVVFYFLIRQSYKNIITPFLFAWMTFAGILLFFSWITILLKHPKDVAEVAIKQDSNQVSIFAFAVVAAFISVFAIILLLQSVPGESKTGLSKHILLTAIAVGFSWTLIHTLFTIRYAHLYYDTRTKDKAATHRKGLLFPGTEQPDFTDFAYFSFVLGMTFQVSDVQITSRNLRKLALLHGLLSFFYNTIIVALSINIISGVLGK
jgi:uncharacterized membrane protein